MLEQALAHLVKGIVEHPDDVRVDQRTLRRPRGRGHGHGGGERLLEVRVHPDDLGKIIGRQGRTARALRTVMTAIGGRGVRVDLVDTDEIR